MKPLRFALAALVGASLTAAASAALTWTSTEFSGATKPLQKTLEVAFAFKNTGAKPVAIREVQVNCDCMSAAADKPVYQPGEAGVVNARFTVGDRIGVYQRSVVVLTDDGTAPQRLHVEINVPELAAVTPRVLDWSTGAAADEKIVDVAVNPDLKIVFDEVFVSATSFEARLATVEAGRRYRLFIKPTATAEAASAAIRVRGKADTGDVVVVSAYANVR